MQAQIQIMPYHPNGPKQLSNLKSMQSVVFEQISTRFIEIFVP